MGPQRSVPNGFSWVFTMANVDAAGGALDAEAAGDETDNELEEGGKKRFSKKMLIIGGVALLLLIGGGLGAAGYFLGWFAEENAEQAVIRELQEPRSYYDLPEITVNLSNAERRAQYLRVVVTFELADPELATVLDPNLPRILDIFQTYLRELRVSDLEGSAGLFRLKHELQRRVNLLISPAEVDAILFREIIVQ